MRKQSATCKSDALPRFLRATCITGLLPALVSLLSIQSSFAGSATWLATPATGDWNTAANWTAGGPPNGSADTATFAVSNTTGVSLSATAEVNSAVFNSGASPFTITASPTFALIISGAGITNNSAIGQNFVTGVDGAGQIGQIIFANSATAGSQTVFTNAGSTINLQQGGTMTFQDSSSAGDAIVTNLGGAAAGARGGVIEFDNTSTAGNAQVTLNGGVGSAAEGGFVFFHDSATAGNGMFVAQGGAPGAFGAWVFFDGNSSAGNGTFVANGALSVVYIGGAASAANGNFTSDGGPATGAGQGGITSLDADATGGNATFTTNGAPVAGGLPGLLQFIDYMGLVGAPTAANATITVNGGEVSGAAAGLLQFTNSSTAENATLVANGGASGGDGGKIQFTVDSTGGAALVTVSGNGNLDISGHNPPGVTIGSIEGSGLVFLGANNLTIGSNNLNTVFSGTTQDGGLNGGTGGSLTKIGKGN